ncbi:hypothetical protein ACHAW6_015937 [Cyclotella cf. meneghiniana]
MDNEVSAEFKEVINKTWNVTLHLVPPDVHCLNAAERAIHTFKAHFLAVLAGVHSHFPNYLWDHLLPQTEITLNLLCQATLAPHLSAWAYFCRHPFDYAATPLGPIGCRVIIHAKPNRRTTWSLRGRDGHYIGPAFNHYRCLKVVDSESKTIAVLDTIEFRHHYLTQLNVTPDDRITHAINFLTCALHNVPSLAHDNQLHDIAGLRAIFTKWQANPQLSPLAIDNEHQQQQPRVNRTHNEQPPRV